MINERQIIIGLITSTEYLQQIRSIWNKDYIESGVAKRLADWCWEYFEEFGEAPRANIQSIYQSKLKEGIPQDIAEEIEEDILPSLSNEFEEAGQFNLNYALTETQLYFDERGLELLRDNIDKELKLTRGKRKTRIKKAKTLVQNFKPISNLNNNDLDLSNPVALDRMRKAFSITRKPLITFPKQLGQFWNDQFVRGAFLAFLGSEKRGKTWTLIELMMRASKQRNKVAFFQAGDMTEDQFLRRVGIYLTKKSDKEKYTGKMYEPIPDCIRNQLDTCDRKERECDFGVFYHMSEKELRKEIKIDQLIDAYVDNPDYSPCHNCKLYKTKSIGSPWLKKVNIKSALTETEAIEAAKKFFVDKKRSVKVATYPNGTLSVTEMNATLDRWEKENGFVPDVIIVDYADLLVPEIRGEFRHQQNDIWKRLRSMSQDKDVLVITATQADAKSYTKNRLSLENFSEDKRKFGHVTAMYGLNQDKEGREKKIGIMRINELVIREDEFDIKREIRLLQNLRRGRPYIGSFW